MMKLSNYLFKKKYNFKQKNKTNFQISKNIKFE